MRRQIAYGAAAIAVAAALLTGAWAALTPNTKAPDFTLPAANGKKITLSDFAKEQPKVVVLDIWATWCGPCRGEIPYLVDLHNKVKKDGATVLGVAIDAQKEPVTAFAKTNKISYPIAFDPNGRSIASSYQISGIPATFIIDKKGVIRYMHTGFPGTPADQKTAADEMEREVRTLLAEK